jgi:hypothetical protein
VISVLGTVEVAPQFVAGASFLGEIMFSIQVGSRAKLGVVAFSVVAVMAGSVGTARAAEPLSFEQPGRICSGQLQTHTYAYMEPGGQERTKVAEVKVFRRLVGNSTEYCATIGLRKNVKARAVSIQLQSTAPGHEDEIAARAGAKTDGVKKTSSFPVIVRAAVAKGDGTWTPQKSFRVGPLPKPKPAPAPSPKPAPKAPVKGEPKFDEGEFFSCVTFHPDAPECKKYDIQKPKPKPAPKGGDKPV